MNQRPPNLKPERIQGQSVTVTPERLQEQRGEIGDWTVDPTPNAIYRHFPHSGFSASVAFLMKAAAHAEKYGREPFAVVDASGVTVRLGNAPQSGVTETDLELAAALTTIG